MQEQIREAREIIGHIASYQLMVAASIIDRWAQPKPELVPVANRPQEPRGPKRP